MVASARLYDDFDLQIRPARDGAYEAAVLRSPAGEVRRTFVFPRTAAEIGEQLRRLEETIRHRRDYGDDTARVFGGMLFASVFVDGVLQAYDQSLSLARSHDRDLRIHLRVLDDPQLALLPWELLYDMRNQRFVALQPDTVLVRTLETLQPLKQFDAEPPLRVLAMAVQPSDLEPLDIEGERRHLERALGRLGEAVDLHWVEGQTWRDLQDALQRGAWHVVHFLGHGVFDHRNDAGYLAFADDQGDSDLRSAEEIARLLGDHDALRLTVLNACEGAQGSSSHMDAGIAQQLVRAGVPAVLALQYAITDVHAIELTRSFYGSLGNGLPIDAAFAEARKALSLAAPEGFVWALPMLVMRSGAEAGRLTRSKVQIESVAIPSWALWLTLALLVGIIALIGTAVMPQLSTHFGPVRMPDGYSNIAVAPFYSPTQTGTENIRDMRREASERAGQLVGALEAHLGTVSTLMERSVKVWGPDQRIQPINGEDAHSYADAINADLLIYGNLDSSGNVWSLAPKFLMSDQYTDLFPELTGKFALGSPIRYRNTAADIREVTKTLRDRAISYTALAYGISYLMTDNEDNFVNATEMFEWAAQNSAWASRKTRNSDGQETLYLLLGNTYLQLANDTAPTDLAAAHSLLDKANDAFEQGYMFNPYYTRLLMAQAGARYQAATDFGAPSCESGWIEIANNIDANYREALQSMATDALIADTAAATHVRMVGHLGLARLHRWRFLCTQLNPHFGQQAQKEYQQVIDLFQEQETSLGSAAPIFAGHASLAHVESGWVALMSDLLESQRGGAYPSLADVSAHWAQAEKLASRTENRRYIELCAQTRQLACEDVQTHHNSAEPLPKLLVELCSISL